MALHYYKHNKQNFYYSAIILAATLLLYAKVVFYDFQLQWDDQWVVINDYTEQGLTIQNLYNIITEFYHGQYAPVNQTYYTLIFQLDGYNSSIFHLCGLLIHCLNGILVYLTLVKILHYINYLENHKKIAFITALLFAIHPINIEAMAWISASKILIYSLFYLCAVIMYLKYKERQKNRYLVYTIILFVLSFGAKEQAVTFPVFITVLDLIKLKNFQLKNFNFDKVFLYVLAITFSLITLKSQGDYGITAEMSNTYNWYQRILLASYTLYEYLAKCILPLKLSFMYPFPFQPSTYIPIWLYYYPFSIIIGGYLIFRVCFNKVMQLGMSIFIIHIAVTLHIIGLSRHAVTADRYAYISSIGITFMISVYFLNYILKNHKFKNCFMLALFFMIAYFAFTSYNRLDDWENSRTLKKDFIKQISERKTR